MTGWGDRAVRFRQAGVEEAAEVLGVLDEAAGWLAGRGISQWPARFERSWIEDAIVRGETWLVEVEDRIAGTVALDWSDPLWDDVDGAAGYVHRLAVRRRAAGLGAVILDWAARTVREHERNALRLDCVATNRGLRAYYEAAGFVHRGDVTVGGAPGQRSAEGPVTVVSRYEKPLAAVTF